MSKPIFQLPIYKKLVKFATANGSPSMTGTVIGSLDETTIQVYLKHMKATDPTLWKKWGSKYKPEQEEEPFDPTTELDEPIDPTADLEDEPVPPKREKTTVAAKTGKKESTAGLDDLFGTAKKTPNQAIAPVAPVTATPDGMMSIDGQLYPQKFRLRGANGLDTDLEVFSKNPKWGLIVRVPVPTDLRKVMLSGGEVEVDLITLKRDPDGVTTIAGKKYSNSKLIAAAELADD